MTDRYAEVRARTEELAAPLSAEDQTVQSMPDVSPTKWHRAHTTWFFETFVLSPLGPGYKAYDESFGFLFNSYYETVGARHPRPQRGLLSRPGIDEIAAYRRYVDEEMEDFLMCGAPQPVQSLVELGLHHEQQHQELLLMDIKHVLSLNPLNPVYRFVPHGDGVVPLTGAPATPVWRTHAGGIIEMGAKGAPAEGAPAERGPAGGFCFDNELPRHQALIVPFELCTRLVTCGEWLAFIDDGGYCRPELWMSDGWANVNAEGWQAPLYWDASEGAWTVFTLGGRRALDLCEPVVHVSWFEADAYARWAGARLPTEAEWEAVAPPAPDRTSTPMHPESAVVVADPEQWYGAVWQWTASPYIAYPGFQPASGAVGEYNGKFMVNQQVLRGSCCATPSGHARRTYRNFFPPAARWAFSGVRLARDVT